MKKVLLLITSIFLLTGCMRVDKTNLDDLTTGILASKIEVYNHTNSGFKFYLPNTLKSIKRDEYNEILKDKDNEYYLYVDLVAHFNKSIQNYEEIEGAYYSKLLDKDNFRGVINVIPSKSRYLVTVTYNYATIETVVDEKDIKSAIANALIVVSTIKYNDDVIGKLLDETEITSNDELVDIFGETREEDKTLDKVDENYNGENSNDEDIYDPDVIN